MQCQPAGHSYLFLHPSILSIHPSILFLNSMVTFKQFRDFPSYRSCFPTVGSGFICRWQGSGRSGVLINMIGHEPAGYVLILMVVLIRAGPSAVERISDCCISEMWFIALNVLILILLVVVVWLLLAWVHYPQNGGWQKQRDGNSCKNWVGAPRGVRYTHEEVSWNGRFGHIGAGFLCQL